MLGVRSLERLTMSVECATCESYMCRTGSVEAAPSHCPMHGEFPSFDQLYSTEAQRLLAHESALVEAEGYCRWTRIEEIVQLSNRMGFARIGVGHCPSTDREARRVAEFLRDRGLDVAVPPKAATCDPASQAAFFAESETQFNVIAGMCVGHDALFIRHSEAPVTSLIVTDQRFRHNPVAALYTSRSYSRTALYDRQRRSEPQAYLGVDSATLERVALAVRAAARPDWCRLEEIMEFAHRLGAKHLGLVFCVGFRLEARTLTEVLRANGFAVSSSCCKTGGVSKERLGIQDAQQVRPGSSEVMCNSLAQAELLNREGAQLALLLGQCVGHDSATLQHLDMPTVCVVAKDRVLGHNTMAALNLESSLPN
jgi:uncharacterized metal-binding protein